MGIPQDVQPPDATLKMTPIDNPPPILAAVIGINKYASDEYVDLVGATVDADGIEQFLIRRLQVPKENIRSLRDEEASRDAIIKAFLFLRDDERYKKDEVAIVIYFSGHGASVRKPEEWGDWDTVNGNIEMLCPSDISSDTSPVVSGIPDRTLSALLNQISERKGDNITVILDCCSSAGMNRGGFDIDERNHATRHIENPPPIQHDCDQQFWPASTRGGNIAEGFTGRFRGSHTLLAACGRDQQAYENKLTKQGLFSTALLKVLASDKFDQLTYTSLMDKLSMPKRQTPHCEGEGKNRRLFNNRAGGADTSLFSTKQNKDGTFIMAAGEMHGVAVGGRLSVHRTNLFDTPLLPNPCLGYLEAVAVNPFFSHLKFPVEILRFRMPWNFYCKPVSSGTPNISLFSRDMKWLETIFPPEECAKISTILVDDVNNCDLELTLEGDCVYFDRHNKLAASYVGSRIRHTVRAEDIHAIRKVVKGSIHFHNHLTRGSTNDFEDVRMEMHALKEHHTGGFGLSLKPDGKNLIAEEPATIVVDEGRPMGMTLYNDGDSTLYPYLFYFDPTEFTIVSWYSPPIGAGSGRHTPNVQIQKSSDSLTVNTEDARLDADRNAGAWPDTSVADMAAKISPQPVGLDAPLPPHSKLSVGYGTGGSEPWAFSIPDGDEKDVGYIMLFLSNRPVSFQNIIQESPFEQTRAVSSVSEGADIGTLDRWAVKRATVIQVRPHFDGKPEP